MALQVSIPRANVADYIASFFEELATGLHTARNTHGQIVNNPETVDFNFLVIETENALLTANTDVRPETITRDQQVSPEVTTEDTTVHDAFSEVTTAVDTGSTDNMTRTLPSVTTTLNKGGGDATTTNKTYDEYV